MRCTFISFLARKLTPDSWLLFLVRVVVLFVTQVIVLQVLLGLALLRHAGINRMQTPLVSSLHTFSSLLAAIHFVDRMALAYNSMTSTCSLLLAVCSVSACVLL
jgi:hypothetical protein